MKKLGSFLQVKYGFYTNASDEAFQELARINDKFKEIMIQTYKNYIVSSKNTSVQILSSAGEPNAKNIENLFKALIANLDTLSADERFKIMNRILASIAVVMDDPDKKAIRAIEDATPDRSYRNELIRQFRRDLANMSWALVKELETLSKIISIEEKIAGKEYARVRGPLARKDLIDFTYTPAAEYLGLSNRDMLGIIWNDYPLLKEKLTTIINALKRKKNPKDWDAFLSEAREIISAYEEIKSKDNSKLFEEDE